MSDAMRGEARRQAAVLGALAVAFVSALALASSDAGAQPRRGTLAPPPDSGTPTQRATPGPPAYAGTPTQRRMLALSSGAGSTASQRTLPLPLDAGTTPPRPAPGATSGEGSPTTEHTSSSASATLQVADGGAAPRGLADAGITAADGGIDPGSLTVLFEPPARWPPELEASALAGEVQLSLVVDSDGDVSEAEVVSATNDAFAREALHAAVRLRFTPLTVGGEPHPARIGFTFHFTPPAPAPVVEVPPPPPPAPKATIAGTVRARGTRRVLAAARVVSDDGEEAETDAEGRFVLRVMPGVRWLRVTAAAHRPGAFKETVEETTVLDVAYGLTPLKANPYETIVHGTRERTEVSRVELRDAEIREVPGTFGDPFRVVMLMPGVSGVVSGLSYPVVRGSSPASTGYFLDGVRVPQLFHALLGPAVVHPDFLDGLDFYAGGAPVRYGRLIGGAVDGRLARRTSDGVRLTAYADFINAGGYAEVPFSNTGTRVSLAGRISYTGLLLGAVSPVITGGTTNLTLDFWDYQARVEQKLLGGRAHLFAFGSSDTVGTDSLGDPSSGIRSTNTQRIAFHRVDASYRHDVGPGEGEARFTFGRDEFGFDQGGPLWSDPIPLDPTNPMGPFIPPTLLGRQKQGILISQTSYTSKLGWNARWGDAWSLSSAATWDHLRAGFLQTQDLYPDNVPGASEQHLRLDQPVAIANVFAGWADVIFTGVPKLTVQGGVRVDHYHLVPGIDHTVGDPRLFARYELTDRLSLRAAAGAFHQAPTFLISLPVVDVAAIQFGMQEVFQTSAGVTWKPWRDLELSADAYLNPMTRTVEIGFADNGIDSPIDGDGVDRNLAPSRPGVSYGLDLMARWPMKDRWFGWLTLSLMRSERLTRWRAVDAFGDATGPVQQTMLPHAFDQTVVANLVVSYRFDNGFSVGTTLHFNTGRPESGELGNGTRLPGVDETGTPAWIRVARPDVARLPAFFRADLRVAKTWVYDAFTLEAWLDMLNVTISQEVIGYDYTRDRTTGGLLKVPTAIPIVIPSLGLKARY